MKKFIEFLKDLLCKRFKVCLHKEERNVKKEKEEKKSSFQTAGDDLEGKTKPELLEMAKSKGLKVNSNTKKSELIKKLRDS